MPSLSHERKHELNYVQAATRGDYVATLALEALALAVQRRNVAAMPSAEAEEGEETAIAV